MSKQEFIQNLRVARNSLVHRVVADSPGINTNAVERRLSDAALWLTPTAVQGFDAADFSELPEATQRQLEQSVRRFHDIAALVPDDGPATAEQRAAAQATLMQILAIMDPYMPTSEETRRLRNAMKEVRFPDQVLTWEFEFGRDSSNDAAVWIWLVVDDAAASDDTFSAATTHLPRQIREAIQRAGLERWPYVRFRTASEQRALQAVGA
ncbi:MAG TPA: hypothetical protein VG269_04500 [Tepidisphaeraceae bacterium]|nr:hypothetical protein [Tepidisphaeraceae bacterium]